MENHPLLIVLILFGVTVLLGLYLISRYFRRMPRPTGVMILHGLFAATAVGTLIYQSAFSENTNVPYASLLFLIVAVFGGILMAVWDKVMNRQMPRLFPLFHAGAAITGIVLLVLFIIRHQLPL